MTRIRPFEEADWKAVWAVLEPVFRAGETYPHPVDISEADARRIWIDKTSAVFVATDGPDRDIIGTCYLKPNQPGLGDHVCNAGYAVHEKARNRGIGSMLCEDSQRQARRLGFRAMQFNLVVATNTPSLRLWEKHGFEILATLPSAFRHPTLGFVDAHVLFKSLAPPF